MALVYDSRWRSLDSNGNPISGATLTIYTAGTTTPAAIFRDAALTVAMSNPTTGADKADSAGRFPQIYAASNALFDILEKDAGGSTIAAYLGVTTLGTTTGSLTLDFTGERVQIRGAGGTGFLEFGDATGDDVGGTGTIGGWNGTQADLITINAALVNIIGRIKEGGFKIPGVVRQAAGTFTTAAFVAIPLTNDPSGCRMFEVDIIDLTLTSTSQSLNVRFSYDGGATYAAAGYGWNDDWSYATTTGGSGSGASTDTMGTIAIIQTTATNEPVTVRMSIVTPDTGNNRTSMLGQTMGFYTGGPGLRTTNFSVYGPASSGRATHVKLFPDAGNMSGIYRVIPQRGLGET